MSCLQALFDQKGLNEEFTIEVFLVDDGSTDGTSEAIQAQFPEVNIIQGDGNLYWNRGMYLAWKTAANIKDFDYYLWLNDDTFLFENAFKVLFKENFINAVVCGTTKSKLGKNPTYGGYVTPIQKLVFPNGGFQKSDYCNGNCVVIPRNVFISVGYLDYTFQHALGDFDYSLRARKKGIEIIVAPEFIGFCESHTISPKWQSNSLNFIERLKNLYTPLSGCYPPEYFIFEKRHNGLALAIVHVISTHLRAIFPKFWKQ